ncbi:MAG: peptidylprolyl isomerase [Proteobacteria bacterium]|nr:peptidylprolyl isomerase [Pseudomonadota bacterium]
MLEQLRRNSRSFIIWILFAIIILAFVFTFGSQSGLDLNCGAANQSTIMTVKDREISVHSLRFGIFWTQGGNRRSSWTQRAQMVLDQLLEREILASAAEENGFRLSDAELHQRVASGKMLVLGYPINGKDYYFRDYQGEKIFDNKLLEGAVQQWSLSSIEYYLEEQHREILADLTRSQLRSSALASIDEARARFEYENTTATIHAVKFRPPEYRRKLILTEAEVGAYLAGHADQVKKKFDDDERLYKERSAEVRVRQIMFKRVAPRSPSAKVPGKEGGASQSGSAAEQPDPGLVAARSAHDKLKGGADFAKLAAQVTEDARTKRKGGDLGWKSLKAPGLGAQVLADALGKLDKGGFSDVIETPNGFYILKVEDKREEGDRTYEQVKHEIAEKLALEYYAKEGARRDAETALAAARAGKKLDELFELQKTAPPSPGGLRRPDGISEEQWQRILQQLQQQQFPPKDEQGFLIYESRDIPAESSWQGVQPSASPDQPAPPAGADKTSQPATASAQPARGSAQPAKEIVIPEGVAKPKLQRIGPFTREPEGLIRGLGSSEKLVEAIFDELSAGQLAAEVYEVGSDFVVVQVLERKNPDLSEFDQQRQDSLVRQIAEARGVETYRRWLQERCSSMAEEILNGVNRAVLQAMSENADQPFRYQPCTYVAQSSF